jgi:hypothetical protein
MKTNLIEQRNEDKFESLRVPGRRLRHALHAHSRPPCMAAASRAQQRMHALRGEEDSSAAPMILALLIRAATDRLPCFFFFFLRLTACHV